MIKERKSEMSKKKNEVRSDAFAFCHGMLGFGEDELVNKVMPYFGGAALRASVPWAPPGTAPVKSTRP